MQALLDGGFVVEDTCVFTFVDDQVTIVEGLIRCIDGLEITVLKIIGAVAGGGMTADVKTVSFSYNARVIGHGNIFRYDSPHSDHNQYPHRHECDFFGDKGTETVTKIDDENDIPTLAEVVYELQDWHLENYSRIPASV